ncbi:GntR family transcriptional regulator [Allokutzneria sp. A3M-2-11 16]|uniref:GntR family transcriptional regulator n=1 Tax=Allokutzneria sp. A3M-2-11 16 TaxID=2962043 RepID=UPI0020B87D16|nr:GntR family transcriptional regulator [Allokutzneria sp. A3M-2-11 16]MCP3798942.1 GntR family transcriptional regulator [Allokutzneria sp. A3M-2-11 16]
MVDIHIDGSSSVPPFEQLRTQLAKQITERTLTVGTRLPTVRKLAEELGLAANTVARAYRELEEAELIETRGRNGSFVSAVGGHSQAAIQRAAQDYAAKVRAFGIDPEEAVRVVRAALRQ